MVCMLTYLALGLLMFDDLYTGNRLRCFDKTSIWLVLEKGWILVELMAAMARSICYHYWFSFEDLSASQG